MIKAQEEQVRGNRAWSKGCQALRPHFSLGWAFVGWVGSGVGMVVVGWGWVVKLVVDLMVSAGLGGVLVRDGMGGV